MSTIEATNKVLARALSLVGVLALGIGIGFLSSSSELVVAVVVGAAAVIFAIAVFPVHYFVIALPLLTVFWRVNLIELGGFNVRPVDVGVVLTILACIVRFPSQVRKGPIDWPIFFGWGALAPALVGAGITSAAVGSNLLLGGVLSFAKRWGLYCLVAVICYRFMPKKSSRSLVWVLLAVSGFVCTSAIIEGLSVDYSALSGADRVAAVLDNPNVLAIYAVLMGNLALLFTLRGGLKVFPRVFSTVLAIMLYSTVFVTGSRTGLVALILSMVWHIFRLRTVKVRFRLLIAGLIGIIVISAVSSPLGSIARYRLNDVVNLGVGEVNVASRIEGQQLGLEIALSHLPFGIGIGNLAIVSPPYARVASGFYVGDDGIGTTDNQYIDQLVESGPLGLLVLVGTLLWMLKIGSRAAATANSLNRVVGETLQISALVLAVSFLAGAFINNIVISLNVWLLIALGLSSDEVGELDA